MSTWGLSSSGPNAAVSGSLNSIRYRTRQLVRNNPTAAGAIDSFVSNLVGTDISPRWELDDSGLKKDLQALWAISQQELDAAGVYDFYGLEELVARSMIEGGEALGRFVNRYADDNLIVPLQVQLLEGDHLDTTYNTVLSNGNEVRMGIEWDAGGRRVAYHLFREHPGEQYIGSSYIGTRVRIPARNMLHIFRPLRIGMAHGVPWLTPILVRLHEIDQYDDAELVRKKVATLFTAFFYTDSPAGSVTPAPFGPKGKDANKNPMAAMEPGTTVRLKPGEKVEFSKPVDVGGAYKDFVTKNFRDIARGIGITYEQLTGDLSDVNFSSIRAGLIEFRRLCESLQVRTLVHQFCRPVIRRWLDAAFLSGAIKIDDYLKNKRRYWLVQWQPDAWEYVDPVKDRIAEQMDVRNGFDSRTAVVARRGRDIERVDEEIAADNKRADEKKLILDSDPRYTAKSGAIQKAEEKAFGDDDAE
jgi:lambda family phage portal protein